MRFHHLVRSIRLTKKKVFPRDFTQSACGARMNPPITQEGWSRYEVEDSQRDYDTVRQIAGALQIPDEEIAEFFKAAGYDLRSDLHLPVEYKNGNLLPLEETPDRREQIEALRRQAAALVDLADKLLHS